MAKADLHIHTNAGDGLDSPQAILDHVQHETDLDVIAITEHDSLDVALRARELWARGRYRFELVAGVEITTLEGHLVALFLEQPVPSLRRVEETLEAVHRQGGVCFVPHPMSWLTRSIGPGTFARLQALNNDGAWFDAIELANAGPAVRLSQPKARRLNTDIYHLPAVGASDAHFVQAIGSAYTEFDGSSAADLRHAFSRGDLRAVQRAYPSLRNVGLARTLSLPLVGLRATPKQLGLAPYRLELRQQVHGMKIALVSPYDLSVPGGVNSHIHHLAANFIAQGNEVRLIAPASDVRAVSPHAIVIGRPRAIPAGGSVARMSLSPRLAGPVRRVLAEEAFDVVHVHEPLVSFLPIQFLRFSNAVNVGTFHAARESGARLYSYTRRLLSASFRRLDGKIAVSPAAAALIAPHFPGYYNIIPNGVDIERFAAPATPIAHLDDGMTNILFVGRLEKRKGLRYLLRAFQEVKSRRPATRLVVVGDDSRYRRGYERWVSEAGLRDVVFAGYVSQEDLPRYHHTAQVFCAPNTGNESQGIVLLEAMAAGLPVVASNIGGFAGVITHGVEGLLVRPKDSEALAEALLQMVDSPDQRQAMTDSGRERAQHFSWERVSQRVLSYYDRLAYEKRSMVTRSASKVEA